MPSTTCIDGTLCQVSSAAERIQLRESIKGAYFCDTYTCTGSTWTTSLLSPESWLGGPPGRRLELAGGVATAPRARSIW